MTPEDLIGGLRERGYTVLRMQVGPVTILPTLEADDPLAEWLSRDLGCRMIPFQPEAWSNPKRRAYEVRLNTAAVAFTDLDPADPDYRLARGMAVWGAAA